MSSLDSNNLGQLALIESDLTFIDVYKGTLLLNLTKENKGVTMKVVYYLLERLNDNFNMNLKLNKMQLTTISFDLLHKFSNETMEDVVLFFRMARLGDLGSKLHRLDSHVIFNEWFPVYMMLKSQNREDLLKDRKASNNMDLMSKEQWSLENKEKLSKILSTFNVEKKNLKINKDYLDNSDSFIESLRIDLKNMSLKELNEFEGHCGKRSELTIYRDIISKEIGSR
tara:strand:- start:666 stop:1343 length:678 start_codon:yes stop_codon:yes gene_type:complete